VDGPEDPQSAARRLRMGSWFFGPRTERASYRRGAATINFSTQVTLGSLFNPAAPAHAQLRHAEPIEVPRPTLKRLTLLIKILVHIVGAFDSLRRVIQHALGNVPRNTQPAEIRPAGPS
jgi:hypothetical protein